MEITSIKFRDKQGTLFLSAAPGSWKGTYQSLYEELDQIVNLGIENVVMLLTDSDLKLNYGNPKLLIREYEDLGINLIRHPIQDYGVPKLDDSFTSLLRQIKGILKTDNVLIHCRAGLGRTGLVASALLISGGTPPKEAIAFIRKKRPGTVETREQEKFLYQLASKYKKHS